MKIKILGTGCAKCKALYSTVETAVAELSLNAEVVKEEDLAEIMNYNVMTLPALVVDEKVVAKGPQSLEQVKKLLSGQTVTGDVAENSACGCGCKGSCDDNTSCGCK